MSIKAYLRGALVFEEASGGLFDDSKRPLEIFLMACRMFLMYFDDLKSTLKVSCA